MGEQNEPGVSSGVSPWNFLLVGKMSHGQIFSS